MDGARARARLTCAHLTLIGLIALLSGCAEIARPPGGPIDRAGPSVLNVTPESLAVGVDRMQPVVITFSEKIAHDSVKEWLTLTPYRRLDDLHWNGPTLSILPRGGWPADTTISILLGAAITDRNLNPLGAPFQRTFATADQVAPGVFAGRLLRARVPAAAAPPGAAPPTGGSAQARPPSGAGGGPLSFVWAYRAPRDSVPEPADEAPDYMTEVGPDGRFRIEGVSQGLYWLFAIQDVDRKKTFSRSRDYATRHADTLRVDLARAAWDDLTLYLINPKEPGAIAGRLAPIDTASGVDTLAWGVLVSPASVEGDTSAVWPPLRVSYTTRAEKGGAFRLPGVPPGSWQVAAWLDTNRDGRWSSDEVVGPPAAVAVEPTVTSETPELARPAPPH